MLDGDAVAAVTRLKEEIDGEIVIPASHQLGRTLMAHGLVDELRLVVFPVVLGAGERFFGETSDEADAPHRHPADRRRPTLLTYEFVHDA